MSDYNLYPERLGEVEEDTIREISPKQAVPIAPVQHTMKAIMEVYRDTANAFDAAKIETKNAESRATAARWDHDRAEHARAEAVNKKQEAERLRAKALQDLAALKVKTDKLRAHRDDLNAKITKARELAANHDNDLAHAITQLLADTKAEGNSDE